MAKANRTTKVLAVIGGIALALIIYGIIGEVFMSTWGTENADTPTKQKEFVEQTASQLFNVPQEAEVLLAERQTGFGTDDWVLRFRLPETKSVTEWMEVLVAGKLIEEYKVNDYLYDAGDWFEDVRTGREGTYDGYRLTYIESEEMYVAEYHWD
ncbi:MAG: hypothetical protein IH945_02920 [Armatimonadetes bacterium]|nr:hypothetical protein [Armatimonadota bacterium]